MHPVFRGFATTALSVICPVRFLVAHAAGIHSRLVTVWLVTRYVAIALKNDLLSTVLLSPPIMLHPVDQLVHRLKFQFQLAIAPLMGKLIYQSIQKENRPADFFPDCVIGVPLGKRRLIERGFNQSHEIARTLAKLLEIELRADLVERNRDTEKQSTVSFQDRKKNVHNAFTVNDKATDFLSGKHIGIVDDVMTTGHTLEEIARVLKKSGVKQVTNFVFARTLPKTSQEN